MTQQKITAVQLRARKGSGEKIVVLTAYDVAFARLADRAGVDVVLVGDSLGMVVQGQPNTLPVTLDEMIYHARAVARGVTRAHVVVDLPFMSYQASVEDGMRAAGRVLKESGAESVKLEGGEEVAALVARLDRCRHSGDGSRGPHAAIDPSAGRLPGAGQDRRAAGEDPAGRPGSGRQWSLRPGAGGNARAPGGGGDGGGAGAHHRHRRWPGLRWPGAGHARSARPRSGLVARASCAATPRWARRSNAPLPPTPPTFAPAASRPRTNRFAERGTRVPRAGCNLGGGV